MTVCNACDYTDSPEEKGCPEKYKQDVAEYRTEGEFFTLPVKMEQAQPISFDKARRTLLGCPRCGNIFMPEYDD